MLQIYDGSNPTLSVDLDDGVTAAIARGGWPQKGPGEPIAGVWPDVEETIRVSLLTASDLIYQRLNLLAQRAEAVQSPTHPDHLNPARHVVMKAKTPDELMPRWALVCSIRVEKLDPSHWRSGGRFMLEIKVLREGLWRGIAPDAPARIVYSGEYPPLSNIDLTHDLAFESDAPSLLIAKIKTAGSYGTSMAIAPKLYPIPPVGVDPTSFSPYLWAGDAMSGPGLVAINTIGAPFLNVDWLPGNQAHRVQTTGTFNCTWWIPLSEVGSYSVCAIVLNSGSSGDNKIRLSHRPQNVGYGDGGIGELIDIPQLQSRWSMLPLGAVRFPVWGDLVRGEQLSNYIVEVAITRNSGTVYLGGLILIPESDTPPHRTALWGGSRVVVDGEVERVYYVDPDYGIRQFDRQPRHEGPFQTVPFEAGAISRVYLLPTVFGLPYGLFPPMNAAWNVELSLIPRWQHLNLITAEILEKSPETIILSGPTQPTSGQTTATFTFSANLPGCTFECRLNSFGWEPVTSPKVYTGLTNGLYTFEVRAISYWGVTGPTSAYEWQIYTGGPL